MDQVKFGVFKTDITHEQGAHLKYITLWISLTGKAALVQLIVIIYSSTRQDNYHIFLYTARNISKLALADEAIKSIEAEWTREKLFCERQVSLHW